MVAKSPRPRAAAWLLCAVLLGSASLAWGAPADDEYAAAARAYAAREWASAADSFSKFADEHPQHDRAPLARFYAGEALVQTGNYDAASRRLIEFLEQSPQHRLSKTAQFRVGECLLLAGKNAEAEARLTEFRKTHPADDLNAFALVYLGDISLEAEKIDDAFARYEQALREFPTSPLRVQCVFGLARCRQLQGKLIEALADYAQVATAHDDPLADDACLQSALIHYQRRDFAAAEGSLVAFRTTFETSELRPQAMYWLGLTQLADRRPAEAIRTLATAAELAGDGELAPAALVASGDALRQAGDAAAADERYKTVLTRWPNCDQADEALHGRLIVAEAAHDEPRAASLASEFMRRFPENPLAATIRLSQIRGQLARREFAAAEPALVEIVAQPPTGVSVEQARYLLALAQLGQQKFTAALATADEIQATDATIVAGAREVRLAALVGLKQYDQALPLLREQTLAAGDAQAAAKLRPQLVLALAGLGKLDEAAEELTRLDAASQADPAVAAVTLQVAERAYRDGNLPLAMRLFGAATGETVPAEVRGQALSGLAWTQYRADGKQASAATFDRLLRDYPTSPLAAEAALLRGHSLEELGHHDAALATYRIVIEKYGTSPQLPAALLAAARLHDKLEQDRDAATLLARLVHDFPEFAELDAALYELAWVQLDLKNADEADAAFARLADDFPQSKFWADATYRLAERAARTKDLPRAAELCDQLLRAQCEVALRERALYLRGQIAATAGDWDNVARFMQQFMDDYPASGVRLSAEYWLAEADFRRERFVEAREKLERLERQADGRGESWLAMAPLRRAQCLAQERKWLEALAVAQPIPVQHPQFKQQYDAEYLIGRCLGSLGRLDEARLAYQRVLDTPAAAKTETAAMAQWMIGETWFHQRKYAEAIAAYERCAAQHSFERWQAASLLQAGKCHLLLGQNDAASTAFQRVAADFGNSPYAAEAAQRLIALQETATASRPLGTARTE
ncbi:MAG: tetratricopeptide repeat protein [Pirellulaceae bacterium]|nr:tetratricopeptide repeat protein [Pirellulaceae bacterium]